VVVLEIRLSGALRGDLRSGWIPDDALGGYLSSLGATVVHQRIALPEVDFADGHHVENVAALLLEAKRRGYARVTVHLDDAPARQALQERFYDIAFLAGVEARLEHDGARLTAAFSDDYPDLEAAQSAGVTREVMQRMLRSIENIAQAGSRPPRLDPISTDALIAQLRQAVREMDSLSPDEQAARFAASGRSRIGEIAEGFAALYLERRNAPNARRG
jgi:hypothetical protein